MQKYLTYVNPQKNNNKYFKMIPNGDGTWTAKFGRIGSEIENSRIFPMELWDKKYHEKLGNGYSDQSALHHSDAVNVQVSSRFREIKNDCIRKLVNDLMDDARSCINENYTIHAMEVTEDMMQAAREMIMKLTQYTDCETFNGALLELWKVLPRKMQKVSDYTAKSENDFGIIIKREEDLLNVMEAIVKHDTPLYFDSQMSILEHMGLEIEEGTAGQTAMVMGYLSESLKKKVIKVYKVVNTKTQKRFNDFVTSNKEGIMTKFLWHGSPNSNWLSILEKGMHVNVPSTHGRMFGSGIYFSPSAKKSWNYTSASNAIYTSEKKSKVYMGLFTTVYGNAYHAYDRYEFYSSYGLKDFLQNHPGCHCVHAHGKTEMLRNDEIIFYRDDQVTIAYLVEFSA